MSHPKVPDLGREGERGREQKGRFTRATDAFVFSYALYHVLYVSGILSRVGIDIYPLVHRAISLTGVLIITFLLFPAFKRKGTRRAVPWYDWLLIAAVLVVNLYLIVNYPRLMDTMEAASTLEIVLGLCALAVLMEAVRRSVGIILVFIGLFFFAYPLIANFMPGFLRYKNFPLTQVIDMVYLYPQGIYGSIMHVYATIVIAFLVFGAFLEVSGAADFFLKLAMCVMGRFRGGPAKVAVLGSAMFGTINGSIIANVAGIGSITIPMMKRLGYRAQFAAAVESVSSTGGQLMPPVMGATAFVMAEILGTSYLNIAIAAAIPAILFYLAELFIVDLEAGKRKLSGIPVSELPRLKQTLVEGWVYVVPLVLLVWLMIGPRYQAQTASIYAIVALILVSWTRKETRVGPRRMYRALSSIGRQLPSVGTATALAGILVATLNLTGVGLKVASGLVQIAGGNLFVLLVMAAVLAIILGMGMPTLPVYLIVVMLIVPAQIMAGIVPLAAHMFSFYYGLAAFITPPVCMAVFVAASMADAPFMRTGFEACRLGIVVFLVPFTFAYSPELLMIGSPGSIALATVTAIIGVYFLACGLQGYFLKSTNWAQRILFLAAGVGMMIPGWQTDVIGLASGLAAVLWQGAGTKFFVRRAAAAG